MQHQVHTLEVLRFHHRLILWVILNKGLIHWAAGHCAAWIPFSQLLSPPGTAGRSLDAMIPAGSPNDRPASTRPSDFLQVNTQDSSTPSVHMPKASHGIKSYSDRRDARGSGHRGPPLRPQQAPTELAVTWHVKSKRDKQCRYLTINEDQELVKMG